LDPMAVWTWVHGWQVPVHGQMHTKYTCG
jgi:hypothetical protein